MEKHITRQLRQDQTLWERKLWYILRYRRLNHLKFRRQVKIGKYIVDFCCIQKKLILELDGGHHNTPDMISQDKKRQEYLEDEGYTVLRFWNHEIDQNLEGVIQKIIQSS